MTLERSVRLWVGRIGPLFGAANGSATIQVCQGLLDFKGQQGVEGWREGLAQSEKRMAKSLVSRAPLQRGR
jgi:hypothetical protein